MSVEVRPARSDDVEGAYAVLCDAHAELYGDPQLSEGMLANMLAIGQGSVADAGDARMLGPGADRYCSSGAIVRPAPCSRCQ